MPCGNGSTTGYSVVEVAGELFIALDLVMVSLVGGSCFFLFDPVFSSGKIVFVFSRESHFSSPCPGEPPPDVVSGENVAGSPRGRPDDVKYKSINT